jgi:rod shape-determining protein MreC
MRSLFNFFVRYYAFFLFLALEIVSFSLVVKFNNFQRVRFLNSSNSVAGVTLERISNIQTYFSLGKQNEKLAQENAELQELLYKKNATLAAPPIDPFFIDTLNMDSLAVDSLGVDSLGVDSIEVVSTSRSVTADEMPVFDSDARTPFNFIAARVISNSVNKQFNYITINKGRIHGIQPDMGVVCGNGIVGVVVNASAHYATVLSLLHGKWATNAKLKKSNHAGILRWGGVDPRFAILDNIPYHVEVSVGDVIVTSGFSTFFPEGLKIGKVESITHDGANNFQQIRVELSTDFSSLYFVYVLKNHDRDEIINLQKTIPNEN